MAALADRMTVAGPRPKELWLTLALSIVLHGLLMAVVILMPRFRLGTYVHVPVSYTVDLVSTTPGGRPAAAAPAKAPVALTPRPAPPVAAPGAAPPPPPAASDEELTLPGKRTARKTPAEVEPSLRPPSVAGKETLRPAPVDARPRPRVEAPTPPARVAAQPPPAAPAGPAAPTTGAAEAGPAKASGVELAGGERGDGTGGSSLGYYLGLVDSKIGTNWNPVATGGTGESVVIVRFRVLRSGNVRNVELESGSADAGLDNAALRAIRQSIPLPPFPNLLIEPYLDLRYTFVMERG